jgi:hypothetical protein
MDPATQSCDKSMQEFASTETLLTTHGVLQLLSPNILHDIFFELAKLKIPVDPKSAQNPLLIVNPNP